MGIIEIKFYPNFFEFSFELVLWNKKNRYKLQNILKLKISPWYTEKKISVERLKIKIKDVLE